MKKIRIISIRKNTDKRIVSLEEDYIKQISPWVEVKIEDIRQKYDEKQPREIILKKEREQFEARIDAKAPLIVLDPSGRGFSSEKLSDWLKKELIEAQGPIQFLMGGPYGFDSDLVKRAKLVLSLSPMTLTHEHSRLVLLEALYRSATLWNHHKYHK